MGNLPIHPKSSRTEGFPLAPQAGKKRVDREKLKKSCSDFESVLVSQMLKSMRQAMTPAGVKANNGLGKDTYTSMFDQELSRSLGKRGGLGIGKKIYDQVIQREERKGPASSETGTPEKGEGERTGIRTLPNTKRGRIHVILGK
jgi:Rod binding domain-containing protein